VVSRFLSASKFNSFPGTHRLNSHPIEHDTPHTTMSPNNVAAWALRARQRPLVVGNAPYTPHPGTTSSSKPWTWPDHSENLIV
jgi:hypothetical protein